MPEAGVAVTPVTSARDLRAFVALPHRLYENDRDWVPPLRRDVRWVLDERRNPFWNHARRTLFLVRREGRVVGRVAAIVDREHNRVHRDRTAFFGFFECEDDPVAARALLGAAERAAGELLPGCDRLRGPVNPSLNHEAGALVPMESEPGPPFVMMTYNPAYYLDLFAAAGFVKEKDLVAILAPMDERSFHRLARLAAGVRKREKDLVVRHIRMDRFEDDVAILETIYNHAWQGNWGFVPMTSEEIGAMARRFRAILHPPYVIFVLVKGTPVAFHLGFPDINQVLKRMGGSLFPFGWLTFLTQWRKIDRCRTLALGVVPAYRKRGIDALLYHEATKAAIRHGHKWAEFSWMLEDNLDILKPLRVFGGRVYRRYRLVAKAL